MSKTPISPKIKRDLWFAAHGRCEFSGCNKRLYAHELTMEECNISNYAHIIGDSENGPRGNHRSKELAKDPGNIILLCPECHRLVDNDVEKYTEELLKKMKKEHEERIDLVTSIQPQKKSLVVAYGPKIGSDTPHFHKDVLHSTIFPNWYPVTLNPVEIQMKNSAMKDGDFDYWVAEMKQIELLCEEKVLVPLSAGEVPHISLFPMAPQPLLVKLGTVLNDKYSVSVYQKHRVPDTWRWLDEEDIKNEVKLIEPDDKTKEPILVLALSAKAIFERIVQRYSDTASIWCITCDMPGNDMMRSRWQLEQFNSVARMAMDAIKTEHPEANQLKIFMAIPASCAVELGRIRMPKADLPWVLYDYRNEKDEDVETITIK